MPGAVHTQVRRLARQLAAGKRIMAVEPDPVSAEKPANRIRRQAIAHGLGTGLWQTVSAADGGISCLKLTGAGRSWLKRQLAEPHHAFRAQHDKVEAGGATSSHPGKVDESPLRRLHRRHDRSGVPWISFGQLAAGEALRRDFTIGRIDGAMQSNWRTDPAGRQSNLQGDAMTETALAARQRFSRACKAIGPELVGPMIDLCCFLKGLEQIEQERHWPQRSGKVVVRLALSMLARHYGYSEELVDAEPGNSYVSASASRANT